MEYKISICIPTYEMVGRGESYLDYSLAIIAEQDYKNFEVIVSDHSVNDDIEKLCIKYLNLIDIKYVRNTKNIGSSSSNLNNSIKYANGDIIKILFQDDFLSSKTSITSQLFSLINNNQKWNVSACAHLDYDLNLVDPHYPYYQQNILFHNTISSPSVLMLYTKCYEKFDDNLLWYMDTDVYHRLGIKYGPPSICENITVINRRHKHQVTNTKINDTLIYQEKQYLNKKYNL